MKMATSTRRQRILEGVDEWAAFYRANPHRFAKDYLNLDLRLFQKILLVMMNMHNTFVFIGARGIGKTFLSAVFIVIRCILYPGTKICIASGTRGQAINVLEKILLELMPNSPGLRNEIDQKASKLNGTDAIIVFKNGSYCKVVTASDSARGNRANILLLDEFRVMDKDTIDTVLRKFLTQQRTPEYAELTKAERAIEYNKELNKTMWLSSAYFSENWSYTKCRDTCKLMLQDGRSDFICGFPYQLSIYEGLLNPVTVEDEMCETDFSEIKFSMEYEAIFWGDSNGSFFDYTTLAKTRKIVYPMLPSKLSALVGNNSKVSIPHKSPGEIRILSVDIALMSSRKRDNDATSIFLNQLVPTKSGRYISNYVFTDHSEGLHTADQALAIRRYYEEFEADYIVIDTAGLGLGVYDALVRDIVDPDTGETLQALSCCNDDEMASRCTTPGAPKVIWSVKGNASFNSVCAYQLRENFRSGKIRLLNTEYDGEASLGTIRGYGSLDVAQRLALQLPYVHTTLLIQELVHLQYEESGNGKVKVYEQSGMRKDRYSSISYNNYVANQLERKMQRRANISSSEDFTFICRPPRVGILRGGGL